jgi:hypothetical protein
LEADLQEQGLWLGDLWTGLLSVRRAAVVASQLPGGSRVYGVDESDAMWSASDYWSAAAIDAIRENTWVSANYGVKESERSSRPQPVTRPADVRKSKADQARMEIDARKMQTAWKRRMEREEE